VIFCTLVTGIAGMEDMKKVGRVGGKALLYFEVVSTLALLIGLAVGNLVHPGGGFNGCPATLDARAVAEYRGQAKRKKVTEFLVHIFRTLSWSVYKGRHILQVLFVSLSFRVRFVDGGSALQTSRRLLGRPSPARFRRSGDLDALRPDWSLWRQAFTIAVRSGVSRSSRQVDADAVHHIALLRNHRARGIAR